VGADLVVRVLAQEDGLGLDTGEVVGVLGQVRHDRELDVLLDGGRDERLRLELVLDAVADVGRLHLKRVG
jgi:hypothetical protein